MAAGIINALGMFGEDLGKAHLLKEAEVRQDAEQKRQQDYLKLAQRRETATEATEKRKETARVAVGQPYRSKDGQTYQRYWDPVQGKIVPELLSGAEPESDFAKFDRDFFEAFRKHPTASDVLSMYFKQGTHETEAQKLEDKASAYKKYGHKTLPDGSPNPDYDPKLAAVLGGAPGVKVYMPGAGGGGSMPSGAATGEAALKNISPAEAALVRKIANYEIDPRTFSIRGGRRERLLGLTSMYDPTYDFTQYASRAAFRKDLYAGQTARNLRSLNTAVGHLYSLKKAAEALNNKGFQLWNLVKNYGMNATGDSSVVRFNNTANAVAGEMAAIFKGTGGTDVEIKKWREQINYAQSPKQLNAGVDQLLDLMSSRLEAIAGQYQSAMGKPKDFHFLNPLSRRILQEVGAKEMLELDTPMNSSGRQGGSQGGADPMGGFTIEVTPGQSQPEPE